jgi:hypothetical protein
MFKALFESFWQGVSIICIPAPRRPAPSSERIIESTHRFVLDLLEFVQDDGLDTRARLYVSWLSRLTGVLALPLEAVRAAARVNLDSKAQDVKWIAKALILLIQGRCSREWICSRAGQLCACSCPLPLLLDLDGNEFIMSQLLSLEEFPFGRRFWCLGWVWPQMTSTFTLSPKPTANR